MAPRIAGRSGDFKPPAENCPGAARPDQPGSVKSLSQNLGNAVMLSEAKHLKCFRANEILRCAQDDNHGPKEFSDRL